jgi:hypothetical protein
MDDDAYLRDLQARYGGGTDHVRDAGPSHEARDSLLPPLQKEEGAATETAPATFIQNNDSDSTRNQSLMHNEDTRPPYPQQPARVTELTFPESSFPEFEDIEFGDISTCVGTSNPASESSPAVLVERSQANEPSALAREAITDAIEGKQSEIAELPKVVGGKPVLLLPGPLVEIQSCAQVAFPLLATKERYFRRDRMIFELSSDGEKGKLVELEPVAFRSHLEQYFWLGSLRSTGDCRVALVGGRCSADNATALLKSDPALEILPKIKVVTASPVFIAKDEQIHILSKGYHNVLGGIFVSRNRNITSIPLQDAVSSLLSLLGDFNFLSGSDKSRAIASLISPALRFGGLLKADFPLDIAEANESQSGKTYRQKLVTRLYGERPFVINKNEDDFGVGSLDERISEGLIAGYPFLMLENVRGSVKSQLLESAIRGEGSVACRRAYSRTVRVETDLVCWMLSSNKAESTMDLANRSIIVRIRKQSKEFRFKKYPEGDLLAHVEALCDYYLSCVLAVLREWQAKARPLTDDARHDFREWCQTFDWIVQNIFGLPPLLDGHRNEQDRLSNPDLNWLREVCLCVERDHKIGSEGLTSAQIVELCETHGIQLPGVNHSLPTEQLLMMVGKMFKRLFRETDSLGTGGVIVRRETREVYKTERRENMLITHYCFERVTP